MLFIYSVHYSKYELALKSFFDPFELNWLWMRHQQGEFPLIMSIARYVDGFCQVTIDMVDGLVNFLCSLYSNFSPIQMYNHVVSKISSESNVNRGISLILPINNPTITCCCI